MKSTMKYVSLIFAILFLYAAVVQYNDPDTFLWVVIYGLAFLSSVLFYFKKLPALVYWIFGLAYLGGCIYNWPETFEGISLGTGEWENVEKAREALGLLVCALLMFLYGFASKKRH